MSDGAGPIRQQLEFLLNGFSFYASRERARADDLLVRERAARAIGEAAAVLRDLASAYTRRHLPPPTREQPLPPRDAMAALRALEALRERVADLETRVRSQPFPASDRTWAHLRSEQAVLDLALAFDRRLIAEADAVHDSARALTLDTVAPGTPMNTALAGVNRALDAVVFTLSERAQHLAPPM